ncbi:MAG: SMP-30/gluconolactonase/LRE family protein, partial [Candidatus Acidiferrales bacterium]
MKKYKLFFFAILIALGLSAGASAQSSESYGGIVRVDPAADAIISQNAVVEKVGGGFGFLEGPVWVHSKGEEYLLFSDIPANVIRKYDPKTGFSVFLEKSGFTGTDASDVGMQINNGVSVVTLIGSNGITIDKQGRIVFCQHGNRDVVRLEKNGKRTVLASKYDGKRFNSPNDLVYRSDGILYFTDPTAGLRLGDKDPKRELPFNGVYSLKNGKVSLLLKDFARPNGIAFSPDEKYLYVNDTVRKIIMRCDSLPDGGISNGVVVTDMNSDKRPGAPDGMKIDQKGNIY